MTPPMARNTPGTAKPCATCARDFVPDLAARRYCSPACRDHGQSARRRDRRAERQTLPADLPARLLAWRSHHTRCPTCALRSLDAACDRGLDMLAECVALARVAVRDAPPRGPA